MPSLNPPVKLFSAALVLGTLFHSGFAPESQAADQSADALRSGRFKWTASEPLLSPASRPDDPCYSVKDPSIVRFDNRWHLFCTIRGQKRTHQIEYLSFDDWTNANAAIRHILAVTNGYFCAPQVFYFEPHQKWYMIYQASDKARKVALQPVFSTSTNITNPQSWSTPLFLYPAHPENVEGWIDFWVICDDTKAHLFFTSNNGKMWRAETKLVNFPYGWSQPEVVLRGDIFEASHTYRLKGRNEFLTVIEAMGSGGRRYYKAYLADKLDGDWKPLAATAEQPFANPRAPQATHGPTPTATANCFAPDTIRSWKSMPQSWNSSFRA